MGCTVKKGSEKGSQKGFLLEGGESRRCLERPLVEHAPLGVCPSHGFCGPCLKRPCSNLPVPKGPFRTKNTTALNSVVFYYCRSFFTICSDLLLNFPLKKVVSKCPP